MSTATTKSRGRRVSSVGDGFPVWERAAYELAERGYDKLPSSERRSIDFDIPAFVTPPLQRLDFLDRRFPDQNHALHGFILRARLFLAGLHYVHLASQMIDTLPRTRGELVRYGLALRAGFLRDERRLYNAGMLDSEYTLVKVEGDEAVHVVRDLKELLEVARQTKLFGMLRARGLDRRIFDGTLVVERIEALLGVPGKSSMERSLTEHRRCGYALIVRYWNELRGALKTELGDADRVDALAPPIEVDFA